MTADQLANMLNKVARDDDKEYFDIVYAENLQSREEYAQLRSSLDSSTTMMITKSG